eukprot:SAG11_NODE_190_length_12980_cov_11.633802_8_plen_105_part_00
MTAGGAEKRSSASSSLVWALLLAGSADVALAERFAVRSLRVLRAEGLGARGGASGREFERVKRIRALPLWQRSSRLAACSVIIIIDRASGSAVQPDIGSLIVKF